MLPPPAASRRDPAMPMTDGWIGRWSAVLREALAVLAAILVAFALDAWWDERVEYRDMVQALEAVADEVDRNLAEIDSTIASNEASAALAFEVLGLEPGAVEDLPDGEILRLAGFPNYTLITLELGAATAFIEGGFLTVVEDQEVRATIAGLPRLQPELDEEALGVFAAMDRLTTYAIDFIPDEVMSRPDGMFTAAASRAFVRAFSTDPEGRRLAFERTFLLSRVYGEEVERTRGRLMEIRETLDRVLANP